MTSSETENDVFVCRMTAQTDHGSVGRSTLRAGLDGLHGFGSLIPWDDIVNVTRSGSRLTVTARNASYTFEVLSPLNGMQDARHAAMISRFIAAFSGADSNARSRLLARMGNYRKARSLVFAIAVLILLACGVVTALAPSQLNNVLPVSVMLMIIFVYGFTFWLNKIEWKE